MSGEWLVLQHVKDSQTGEVQSLVYDFAEETLELVPGEFQEGRLTRGFAVPGWSNGKTIDVVQSLPLGSVGECYVEELHGVEADIDNTGIYFRVGERAIGRLVGLGHLHHWRNRTAEAIKEKVRMISAGTMRVIHDGEGQIFRFVKGQTAQAYRKKRT